MTYVLILAFLVAGSIWGGLRMHSLMKRLSTADLLDGLSAQARKD